jgi:hypothetical protein
MPNQLVTFDHVELLTRDAFGFRCRVGEREVWIGNLQWQKGTTVHAAVGDRLVLRRADAAELGLIDWKPGDP